MSRQLARLRPTRLFLAEAPLSSIGSWRARARPQVPAFGPRHLISRESRARLHQTAANKDDAKIQFPDAAAEAPKHDANIPPDVARNVSLALEFLRDGLVKYKYPAEGKELSPEAHQAMALFYDALRDLERGHQLILSKPPGSQLSGGEDGLSDFKRLLDNFDFEAESPTIVTLLDSLRQSQRALEQLRVSDEFKQLPTIEQDRAVMEVLAEYSVPVALDPGLLAQQSGQDGNTAEDVNAAEHGKTTDGEKNNSSQKDTESEPVDAKEKWMRWGVVYGFVSVFIAAWSSWLSGAEKMRKAKEDLELERGSFLTGKEFAEKLDNGEFNIGPGAAWFERNMVMTQKNVDEGRWHVFMTYAFGHRNPLHLLTNSVFFMSFAKATLAAGLRPAALVGICLVSAPTSSLIQWMSIPDEERTGMLGASAMVAALLGAALVAKPSVRILSAKFRGIPLWVMAGLIVTGDVLGAAGFKPPEKRDSESPSLSHIWRSVWKAVDEKREAHIKAVKERAKELGKGEPKPEDPQEPKVGNVAHLSGFAIGAGASLALRILARRPF